MTFECVNVIIFICDELSIGHPSAWFVRPTATIFELSNELNI